MPRDDAAGDRARDRGRSVARWTRTSGERAVDGGGSGVRTDTGRARGDALSRGTGTDSSGGDQVRALVRWRWVRHSDRDGCRCEHGAVRGEVRGDGEMDEAAGTRRRRWDKRRRGREQRRRGPRSVDSSERNDGKFRTVSDEPVEHVHHRARGEGFGVLRRRRAGGDRSGVARDER